MFNWKKVILKPTNTMLDAIKVLDKEALRIVIVVDENQKLIGTVTDGDIRRSIVKLHNMKTQLIEFMHIKPTVAFLDESETSIISKMKELDLLQLPVVDKNYKIVGLKTMQGLLENKKFDNPVLLMAGGFGRRLKPLTNNTPKPLLKIGSKPILENILDQFIDSGFHKFYISTHYKADMVKNYFGDGSNWGVSIEYIHEHEPLGTAGSLGLLPKKISKLPLIVMNSDLLTKIDFEQLLEFHIDEGGEATMCVREYDFQVPYGVINANGYNITSIQEKPVQKFFVNAGIYVLNTSIFDNLSGKDYLDMTQFLERKIKDNSKVNMFPMYEYWLDIGQIDQFNQAQQDLNFFSND